MSEDLLTRIELEMRNAGWGAPDTENYQRQNLYQEVCRAIGVQPLLVKPLVQTCKACAGDKVVVSSQGLIPCRWCGS